MTLVRRSTNRIGSLRFGTIHGIVTCEHGLECNFVFLVSLLLPDEENESKDKVTEDGSSVTTATDANKSIQDKWYPQLAYASDKAILIEVEELEEKVFSASLQVKVETWIFLFNLKFLVMTFPYEISLL